MSKFLLMGLLLALTVMPSYASANLLTNPGFETGNFANWNRWGETNSQLWSGSPWAHSGTYGAVSWWWTGAWQDIPIADPNVLTTVGGWIYDDASDPLRDGVYGQIKVEFKNASDVIRGTWSTGNLTGADLIDNSWNEKTAQVTPSSYGPDIVKATFVWEVSNTGSGSGRASFDDLIVEPIPEPASLLMLGFGLVGLGIFKRKIK